MIFLVSKQSSIFVDSRINVISLSEAIDKLSRFDELALDTETTGLDCFTKKLLLLQLGNKELQILFDIASYEYIIPEELKHFLKTHKCLYILQNAKFDLKFLFMQGIVLTKVYDTMLVEIILTNGLQYSGRDLATIVDKYCNVHLDKSVRGDIIKNGLTVPVLLYGARDIEYLAEVKRKQLTLVNRFDLEGAINLDNAFVIALAYTEFCGIKLNYNKWLSKTSKNITKARELSAQLNEMLWTDGKTKWFSGMLDLWSGEPECKINWNSPKQVIELFKTYGINVILKDKGVDRETVDAKVLEPQRKQFPIVSVYLDYKEVQKEISTYGESWSRFISPVTGRIHTTFQQLMDTGRLSCGNKRDGTPNLQNIPSDEETRSCFICEEGAIMIDADYSSQEQVVMANFSQEPNLLNFYKKGFTDMHSYIAFLMFPNIRRCEIDELTPERLKYIKTDYDKERYLAKVAGFAINYGGNGSTIAKNCSIPAKDGDFVYKSYFESFPQLKQYFDDGFAEAISNGYITFNDVTKRKLFFDLSENYFFKFHDEINDPYFWQSNPEAKEIQKLYNKAKSEIQRTSQNYRIQGSAADITKYATILFFKEILNRNWFGIVKIVNLVHDEILLECPIHMEKEVTDLLITCMKNAGKPFCRLQPLGASAISGDHWVH